MAQEANNSGDNLALGGNIVLSGFKDVERSSMIVVKKIVGNYARKFSDATGDMQELALHMKTVHETEKGKVFELHGKATAKGKVFTSQVEDRNLFFAMDKALNKLQTEIMK